MALDSRALEHTHPKSPTTPSPAPRIRKNPKQTQATAQIKLREPNEKKQQ